MTKLAAFFVNKLEETTNNKKHMSLIYKIFAGIVGVTIIPVILYIIAIIVISIITFILIYTPIFIVQSLFNKGKKENGK